MWISPWRETNWAWCVPISLNLLKVLCAKRLPPRLSHQVGSPFSAMTDIACHSLRMYGCCVCPSFPSWAIVIPTSQCGALTHLWWVLNVSYNPIRQTTPPPPPRNIGCEDFRICFSSSFDYANISWGVITNSIVDCGHLTFLSNHCLSSLPLQPFSLSLSQLWQLP